MKKSSKLVCVYSSLHVHTATVKLLWQLPASKKWLQSHRVSCSATFSEWAVASSSSGPLAVLMSCDTCAPIYASAGPPFKLLRVRYPTIRSAAVQLFSLWALAAWSDLTEILVRLVQVGVLWGVVQGQPAKRRVKSSGKVCGLQTDEGKGISFEGERKPKPTKEGSAENNQFWASCIAFLVVRPVCSDKAHQR